MLPIVVIVANMPSVKSDRFFDTVQVTLLLHQVIGSKIT